jgi:NAD(P) transhydrogenase
LLRRFRDQGDGRIAAGCGRGLASRAVGEEVLRHKVLFVAGRKGNTDGIGLAEAGVRLDDRGRIQVDAEYRTTVPWVFAAGDVIGPPALASVSAEQGRVAACHAFDIPFKESVDQLPPFGIYSIPEVGGVGMSEEQAAAAGIDHTVGTYHFADNPRSRIAGTTYGLIKLVLRRDDRRLLGVHIVGEEAAELIHIGQAVIHANETIDRFIDTTFNIPTRSEAYKYAVGGTALQRLAALRRTGPEFERRGLVQPATWRHRSGLLSGVSPRRGAWNAIFRSVASGRYMSKLELFKFARGRRDQSGWAARSPPRSWRGASRP